MPSSVKEDLQNRFGKEKKIRLPSGKVYALHLFVLVFICQNVAYRVTKNRKRINTKSERKWNAKLCEMRWGRVREHLVMGSNGTTIQKKIVSVCVGKSAPNITESKTLTLFAVHTAKVSTKQDVWKLYFSRFLRSCLFISGMVVVSGCCSVRHFYTNWYDRGFSIFQQFALFYLYFSLLSAKKHIIRQSTMQNFSNMATVLHNFC